MPKEPSPHPPAMRWLLKFGKLVGVEYEQELNVRVIYRMGRYAGVRGPGRYTFDRASEKLGPQIYVGGQRRECTFQDMLAQDGLPMTVQLNVLYKYDPRNAPEAAAAALTRATPEARANLVDLFAKWATRTAINKRNSLELPQYQVTDQIELELKDSLLADMKPLGFDFPAERPVRVLQILPPAKLTDRHAENAQRRAHILASEGFNPADYRRALIAEFLENLAQTGGGESIVNFSDIIDSYAPDVKNTPEPRIIDQAMPPRDNPPPSPPPTTPSGKPRPKSRLE